MNFKLAWSYTCTVHLSWFSTGKLTFNIHGQKLRIFSGKELFTENSSKKSYFANIFEQYNKVQGLSQMCFLIDKNTMPLKYFTYWKEEYLLNNSFINFCSLGNTFNHSTCKFISIFQWLFAFCAFSSTSWGLVSRFKPFSCSLFPYFS